MTTNTDDRLSGALQENLLTLLCFDQKYATQIRYAVKPQLFESSVFREVAGIAIDFIDQFRQPVGDHLPDHLESILKGDDARKAKTYQKLIENLFIARDHVNGEYVLSQLKKFVRAQNMKSAVITAAEALEDGRVDDAEVAMQKALSSQITTFEGGTDLSDPQSALKFLDAEDEQPMVTGIDALDEFGAAPAKKTLFLALAPTNRGKSWWLMHLGKWAILQGLSVLHITLEMSESKCAGRYMQSFFSLTKRQGMARVTRLRRDPDGALSDIYSEEMERPSLADDNIRAYLGSKIRRELSRRPKLKIKSFPSGQLTMSMLNAYLDGLERFEKFTPDLLLLDYVDIMAHDPTTRRESIGATTIALRGLASERNLAAASATQTNRTGISAKVVDETHLSEDVSKAFTADCMVTYNQTNAEYALGLARLFVAKNRDDVAKTTALITQSYAIGQFCLDSVQINSDYWDIIAPEKG